LKKTPFNRAVFFYQSTQHKKHYLVNLKNKKSWKNVRLAHKVKEYFIKKGI